MRLTTLAEGKPNFALTFLTREFGNLIPSIILLVASIAILTMGASAQGISHNRASSSVEWGNVDWPSNDSPDSRTSNSPNSPDCASPEFPSHTIDLGLPGKSPDAQESSGPVEPKDAATAHSSIEKSPRSRPVDFNRNIYYRNKLEFALDVGWLPLNIPFPFDVFEGDPYDLYPLRYTLVPIIASLRWQVDDVGSRWIFRGNWDVTASGSFTAIPKGAETRYFSYDMGLRRNFVHPNWRVVPYVDIRAGLGLIDAKGPLGVYYAQGQNYTFTMNMGAGARYNFSPRYAISAGLNWMHISNNNLSAPQYSNYGINVYGPIFGIDVQLRRHSRHSEP